MTLGLTIGKICGAKQFNWYKLNVQNKLQKPGKLLIGINNDIIQCDFCFMSPSLGDAPLH